MTDFPNLLVFVIAFLAGAATMFCYLLIADRRPRPKDPATCAHTHTATVYHPTMYRETCTDCGTNLEPGEGRT